MTVPDINLLHWLDNWDNNQVSLAEKQIYSGFDVHSNPFFPAPTQQLEVPRGRHEPPPRKLVPLP